MNCKHCQQELEAGVTLCPNCGTENTGVQTPEKAESTDKTKLWLTVAAVVAVALLGVGLIMFVLYNIKNDSRKNDPTTAVTDTLPSQSETTPATTEYVPGEGVLQHQSYTVTEDEAASGADTVVATVGDSSLTNRQLQMLYWMQFYEVWNYYYSQYSYYTSQFIGLDYTQPFDQQYIPDGTMNWDQYLTYLSLNSWHRYRVLADKAVADGYTVTEDMRKELDETRAYMEEAALENGLADANALLAGEMGAGVTIDDYLAYMQMYMLGQAYFEDIYNSCTVTEGDMESYYTANHEALGITKEDGNVADVRHILIVPEGGTQVEGSYYLQYTDEEWAACLAQAQKVLDEWKAGEATEASFTELTGKYTQDTGYVENGGLYTDITEDSQYVPNFKAWAVDAGRKAGDCELVQTEYGYHIMYLVTSEPIWVRYCRESIKSDYCTDVVNKLAEQFPLEVDYDKIAIAGVSFE